MHYISDTGIISLEGNCLTWNINNFFSFPLNKFCEITSKQFAYLGSRYTLYIWPRGHKGSDTENWFGLCLYKYDAPGVGDSVQFSIAGINRTCRVQCSEHNLFRQERFIEWSDFLTLKRIVVPNGCLRIVCELYVENSQQSYAKSGNNSSEFFYPKRNLPLQSKLGDYQSYDLFSFIASFRIGFEDNFSSFETPGSNYGASSTVNSFCSSSTVEKSYENLPDSMETRNSNFKTSHGAEVAAKGNTPTDDRDSERVIEEQNPGDSRNLHKDRPIRVTSKSTKVSTNTKNSPQYPGKFKTAHSLDETADTKTSTRSNEAPTSVDEGLQVESEKRKNLYLEGKDFDLIINMDEKEFKVHRNILKERSPFFADLPSSDVAGNSSCMITIDPFDACDSTAFHHFLLYVYTGEIENLYEKNLYGLYCAACKFEMSDLKEDCLKLLQTSFTAGTIIDIFRSADANASEWWKVDVAVDFLAKNMKIIMKTDEWKQFLRHSSDDDYNLAIKYQLKALDHG